MIEVRHVEKRYRVGDTWLAVLRGVSLAIAAGEFVAIVGPSGAGKSTLLHLIGGLDLPTAGSVTIDGRAWDRMTPAQQARLRNEAIGFVFQSYHLLPELTALENTMLPALMGWRSETSRTVRAQALDWLGRVGLSSRAAHRPGELSGGEQQRVAIARALMNRPRLLLCDEPTGNLDTVSGEAVLDILIQCHRQVQTTLVIVTHEATVAQAAGRVVQMRDGRIVEELTREARPA